MSVIDTAANAIVKRLPMRYCDTINDVPENCGTVDLAISPDGQRLYVVNAIDESIEVLDTADDSVVGRILLRGPPIPDELNKHPVFVTVAPDGQLLAVSHSYADSELAQPNFIWLARGLSSTQVLFSDSPSALFSERALAIASVPGGCVVPPTATPTITVTPLSTPTPTPSRTPMPCVADCSGNGRVTVEEILTAVDIALGSADLGNCPCADADGDGAVTVDEILAAVNTALSGCAP